MNYDHHHHAGNAADCIKHLALSLTLQALIRKDTPLAYIDTHAGAGQYTLGVQGEHMQGVARLWADRRSLPHAGAWLKIISNENSDGRLRHYPGSPALAAALLRPGDR
ncbi:23S rRNA (adenine(2030)-N(6))-methyltransferase RlmJ, partial [Acidithiobacillus sp. MC6.1]|nr:23S rRNA (adenine(2030)-N(6))-methyltransferase RlmJ [Acidithiobacillus sp. MC6.1]